jgi:hypothetical protein
LAALAPFLTLYYEGLGMSGRQIGVLAATLPLVSLFAASLWGGLADATRQQRRRPDIWPTRTRQPRQMQQRAVEFGVTAILARCP